MKMKYIVWFKNEPKISYILSSAARKTMENGKVGNEGL